MLRRARSAVEGVGIVWLVQGGQDEQGVVPRNIGASRLHHVLAGHGVEVVRRVVHPSRTLSHRRGQSVTSLPSDLVPRALRNLTLVAVAVTQTVGYQTVLACPLGGRGE